MPTKPPKVRYAGGPLDGITRERPERGGRRPRYRDADGSRVQTFRLAKYRVQGCPCNAFTLYGMTDDGKHFTSYRWLDEHNPDNHR